jgi:glutaredoxin
MRSVVLYTRSGCHLCDEARTAILSVRAREPFGYDEVDIDTDDDLLRDYGVRIPVVTVDGEERFEIAVDEHELEGLVRIR